MIWYQWRGGWVVQAAKCKKRLLNLPKRLKMVRMWKAGEHWGALSCLLWALQTPRGRKPLSVLKAAASGVLYSTHFDIDVFLPGSDNCPQYQPNSHQSEWKFEGTDFGLTLCFTLNPTILLLWVWTFHSNVKFQHLCSAVWPKPALQLCCAM